MASSNTAAQFRQEVNRATTIQSRWGEYFSCEACLECHKEFGIVHVKLVDDWLFVLFPDFRLCIWKIEITAHGKLCAKIIYDALKTPMWEQIQKQLELLGNRAFLEQKSEGRYSKDFVAIARKDGYVAILCPSLHSFQVIQIRGVLEDLYSIFITPEELFLCYKSGLVHVFSIRLPYDSKTRNAIVEASETAFASGTTPEQVVFDDASSSSGPLIVEFANTYVFHDSPIKTFSGCNFRWPVADGQEPVSFSVLFCLENGFVYGRKQNGGGFEKIYECGPVTMFGALVRLDGIDHFIFHNGDEIRIIASDNNRVCQISNFDTLPVHVQDGKWHRCIYEFYVRSLDVFEFHSYDYHSAEKMFYANPVIQLPLPFLGLQTERMALIFPIFACQFLSPTKLNFYLRSIENYLLSLELDDLYRLSCCLKLDQGIKTRSRRREMDLLEQVVHVCFQSTLLLFQRTFRS